ncbi:Putative crumbs log 2b [Trichuris trichiura]|uniref:Putative crumbs log 2b n=1 Tax=Trichuris trichiura TaxID=36087 RepID=A0A077Z354_TRITR|nr:Putative crumbs log 2b [Trichuris trichiura]
MCKPFRKVAVLCLLYFWWSSPTEALCPHELNWTNTAGFEFDKGCINVRSLKADKDVLFDDLVKICQDKFGPSAVLADFENTSRVGDVILGGKIVHILKKNAANFTALWVNFTDTTFRERQFAVGDCNTEGKKLPLCIVTHKGSKKCFPCSSPIPKEYINGTSYVCFTENITKCRVRDDKCDCEDGYEGEFCLNVKGKCTNDVCKNKGYCVPMPNSYKCICPGGVTGQNCELDFQNECTGVDCSGRGTCKDLANNFECHCESPYNGSMCELLLVGK